MSETLRSFSYFIQHSFVSLWVVKVLNCPCLVWPPPWMKDISPGAWWSQDSQDILKLFLQLGAICQCCIVHTENLASRHNWRCEAPLPCFSLPVGRLLSWFRWKRYKILLQDGEATFQWRNDSTQQILLIMRQASLPCFLHVILKQINIWKQYSKGCNHNIFESAYLLPNFLLP